jgi:hypothetical protein
VPGLVDVELLADPPDDRAEVLLLDRPADAVSVESLAFDREPREVAGRLTAEVFVLCALDDAEQGLGRFVGARGRQAPVLDEACVRARDSTW